ncbi:MAG: 4-hydroxyphenylacetate 3-hydroxylase N-terminal domain-containing protein, partial [bacterium]
MIRTGEQYRDGLRDGREVYMDGARVEDVAAHPQFKPVVDIRARIYDLAHDADSTDAMTCEVGGERCAIGLQLPRKRKHWRAKRAAVDWVMKDIGGVVTRVGDETIGEMWSLWDGAEILNEIDSRFAENIERHIHDAVRNDPFHVSANTDPKGDRSKKPQEQDPDMLVRVVEENDNGLVIRGAKYETAAAYSDQAFLKPTIANWGDAAFSDYAVGCIVRMNARGVKHICRAGFATADAGDAEARKDYPLSNRFDEIDTLMILDNVHIPWEDVLFYRHTRAAAFIRATLHRYSAFPFVQRILTYADMMIGAALWNIKQTGLERQPAVQEKLAQLAVYREGINAHLTAAIAAAQRSPRGLLMPHQSLLFTGRVHACANLPAMMHIARELCGGQICVTP